jgi:hypothetical protein
MRLCALLLLLLTPLAHAELVMVESVDYRVAHADRVVVGTVTALGFLHKSGGYDWRHARLRVEETIRGPASEEVDVLIRGRGGTWKHDARVLVFLVDPRRFKRVKPPHYPRPAWMADLGWSGLADKGHGAIALSNDMPALATRNGGLVRTPAQLLDAVRMAAKQAAATPAKGILVDITLETEAGKALYSGSAVELRVPVDDILIAQARTWATSTDLYERTQAVDVWAAVDGAEAEQRLRAFLTDPGTAVQTDGKRNRTQVWPVRRRARDALLKRGLKPGPVVLEAPMPPPIGRPR